MLYLVSFYILVDPDHTSVLRDDTDHKGRLMAHKDHKSIVTYAG